MKAVLFNAGLGNQIFTYLFCRHLQRRFPRETIRGCYWLGGLQVHGGLEIDRVFDVRLPRRSFCSDVLGRLYVAAAKTGLRSFLERHEFAAWNKVFDFQRLDQKYFRDLNLRDELPFREEAVGQPSRELARRMEGEESVAVHVRRGDYFSPENYEKFGRFCPPEYYVEALSRMKALRPEAKFYFFSDDMDYVRREFAVGKAVFVDANRGGDSWKDLYLMASCRHHIIANSTFSYWAAQLCRNPREQIVIAPKKWYVWDDPDIFPAHWVRL